MKNVFKKIVFACLAITVVSCNDDDETPKQQSIAEIAIATADFSTLETALNRTGLTTVLNGNGQFTVFAPTNAAFQAFFTSLGPAVTVDNVDVAVLTRVLLNHVIAAEVKSSAISTGYVSTLSPFNETVTISMFIQKTGANVFINGGTASTGVRVTTADVDARNGVIHIVNAVIAIPTVVDHVVANPEFDTLQAVVTSGSQSAVLNALSGLTAAMPATLFAPNNAAFATALGTGGFANGATDASVTKVLQYHVTVAGNVRAAQLTNNQVIPMFTTPVQNVTVILGTNTVDIRDTVDSLSRVFVADIQCSNGVIHGVNRVLRPSL